MIRVFWLIIILVFTQHHVYATVMPSEKQLMDEAELIVIGRIDNVTLEETAKKKEVLRINVKINRVLKGNYAESALDFLYHEIDGYGDGGPSPAPGAKEYWLKRWNGYKDNKTELKIYLKQAPTYQYFVDSGITGWVLSNGFGYVEVESIGSVLHKVLNPIKSSVEAKRE